MTKKKIKSLLRKIERVTQSYAYCAQEWTMEDEGDYYQWVEEIEKILKGEE